MILTKEQCNEIISWMDIYGKTSVKNVLEFSPSGRYKDGINYNITDLPRDKNTQWIFDTIENFLKEDYPNNSISNTDSYFYINEFYEGGKFDKHIDKKRNCSWSVIVGATLNSEFEGGHLLTYNPDGILAQNVGELYKMDSKHLHEVTKITKGTRYSFVCFVQNKLLGIDDKLI